MRMHTQRFYRIQGSLLLLWLLCFGLLAILPGLAQRGHREGQRDHRNPQRRNQPTPPAQWQLTENAIRHIQKRHFPESSARGAGKFIPGTDVAKLRDWIETTFQAGNPIQSGRPGKPMRWQYEHFFPTPIGDRDVDGRRADLKGLRLILEQDGTVVTAFPIRRPSQERQR